MVTPPEIITRIDNGRMFSQLAAPLACPWRVVQGKGMFECYMPGGPAGKRGCPQYDCFPAGCPMIGGVSVTFKMKE
jgi:hypothetical protein